MNIGELFVSLGIKGDQKSLNAIAGLRKGLKDTASVGLETKAAIFGAVYALERLFASSGQYGTNLTNFNATLGVSAKTLQQYQYAARQVGVANEAVEASFRGLQSTITKQLLGKGAPEGLAMVAQTLARAGTKMNQYDLKEFADDPSKLLQRLQQYAQLEKNAGLRNEVLKSFGIGDDMIAGLTRNAFRPEVMAQAPVYSDRQIKNLDEANIGWANLGAKIQKGVGDLNADHGKGLVKNIDEMVDKGLELTKILIVLSEKLKLFELAGKSLDGWKLILQAAKEGLEDIEKSEGLKTATDGLGELSTLLGHIVDLFIQMEDKVKLFDKIGNVFSALGQIGKMGLETVGETNKAFESGDGTALKEGAASFFSDLAAFGKSLVDENVKPFLEKKQDLPPGVSAGTPPRLPSLVPGGPAGAAAPTPPPQANIQGNTTNVNVNQTMNFAHEGKDAKLTGKSVQAATEKTFRQNPALARGT